MEKKKVNSIMTNFIHRWFAWILVFPLTSALFTFASLWTLSHNPLLDSSAGSGVQGTGGLSYQLARSQARIGKLQVILDATNAQLQQINSDISLYTGKAAKTKAWAKTTASNSAPATNSTTKASGAKP